FDLILSVFSLMYKKNLKAVLKEFRRILKKDGELLVVVPHPIERMVKHIRNYFKRGKFLKINGNIRYFNYHWTLEDYLNSIISQGFRVEEIKELGSSSLKESYYPHYLVIRAKAI
ncbi:MAG TPA: methyltransferase domain-containing protein, partial [Candidatus Aenigmarchaeota archaeon]|nr:methyltransferase domain-containing protein [Candidatus Aenigmarchaeota archaeon]